MEDEKKAEWKQKENPALVDNLRGVIDVTKKETERQIELLKKKLDKLTYGS